MTYDGAEVRIYINGEVDATAPASGAIEASDGELRIGRGDPAGYFSGLIDEVAIFQVALSQDEINEVMNEGLADLLSVEPQAKLVEDPYKALGLAVMEGHLLSEQARRHSPES